jgi:uncharacterized protein (TIGR02453 family)
MLQNFTIKFLKDLKKNNNKAWFDNNRKAYENAKSDFAAFVQQLIEKQGKKDKSISALSAKDCMFRINRDIRFSKDKLPYKTNFGAFINKGGKKSNWQVIIFTSNPGNHFSAGDCICPCPKIFAKCGRRSTITSITSKN